jgi:hypothetical protein
MLADPLRADRPVGDASVPQDAQARERQRWTKAVAARALSAEVIVGGDGAAGVEVESMTGSRVSCSDGATEQRLKALL